MESEIKVLKNANKKLENANKKLENANKKLENAIELREAEDNDMYSDLIGIAINLAKQKKLVIKHGLNNLKELRKADYKAVKKYLLELLT